MMNRLVICTLWAFVLVKQARQCALPYWWIEAYSLPTNLQSSAPKSAYHYRESFQAFDPYNYVHTKEYTEYSWWEHSESSGTPGVKGAKVPPSTTKGGRPPPSVPATTKGGRPPPTIPTTTTTRRNDEEKEPEEDLKKSVVNPEVERNENEATEVLISDEMATQDKDMLQAEENAHRSSSLFPSWFGSAQENETKPCRVSEADIHSLRSMIEKMFSFPRDNYVHPDTKEKARHDILEKFRNFGLQVWVQNFTTMSSSGKPNEEPHEGVNLIGVIPGSQRGQMNDGIVLVGAHYDTVAESNGVDDNGSGLAVMLEVAKALSEARCRLNNTLMFVAFDLEEDGAMGSNYFVEHYLIPEELKRARAHFQGAFILDGVMNFNNAPNTQRLPVDFAQSLPGLQSFVNYTGNRGDFLAMISRNSLDNHLTRQLMESWQKLGDNQYKLFNLAVDMGNEMPPPSVLENHLNFLNSDHATFWYHNSSTKFPESLNAVLLTDTGPFRGQMQKCYHSECDDLTNMSPEKLQFAKKTADALTATLVELTRATASGEMLRSHFCTIAIFAMTIIISKINF